MSEMQIPSRVVEVNVRRSEASPAVGCRWTLQFDGMTAEEVADMLAASNSVTVRLQAAARKAKTDTELKAQWGSRTVKVRDYLPGRRIAAPAMTPEIALATLAKDDPEALKAILEKYGIATK